MHKHQQESVLPLNPFWFSVRHIFFYVVYFCFVRMRACHASVLFECFCKDVRWICAKIFLIAPFDVNNKRNGKRFSIYFAILTAHDYMVSSISSIAFSIVCLLPEQTSQPTSWDSLICDYQISLTFPMSNMISCQSNNSVIQRRNNAFI